MMELKKVKYHEDMSEETTCFSAEIWENGKLVAYAKNNGRGGSNMITPAKGLTYKDVEHLTEIEKDCEILEMVEEYNLVSQKQSKALVMKKDGKFFTLGLSTSIAKAKQHPASKLQLENIVREEEKKGYTILNRNL